MTKNPTKKLLAAEIVKLIKQNSFIGIDEFIKLCLFHPEYGYYTQKSPIGKEQDFTTSAEISQLFGEMLGFWLIAHWQKLGEPNKIHLVELGPGNGTLMLDLLNLVRKVPKLYQAINLHLVEINPILQKKQQQQLAAIISEINLEVSWLTHLSLLQNNNSKKEPIIIIANEFLDVFPIKQFKYINNNWHEAVVTLSKSLQQNNFSLALSKNSTSLNNLLPPNLTPKEGMIFEYSSIALSYFKIITNLLLHKQGAAVIIDYGYTESCYTNTIQALKSHKYVNFLTTPGETDITHLVNFPLFLKQLEGLNLNYNITTQKQFFTNLGIEQRLEILLKAANQKQKSDILLGTTRILDEKGMGSLFKVLEITTI